MFKRSKVTSDLRHKIYLSRYVKNLLVLRYNCTTSVRCLNLRYISSTTMRVSYSAEPPLSKPFIFS